VKYLKGVHKIKRAIGYPFVKGDIQWTTGKLIKLMILGLTTGVLSSMLGLGGGVIFNPILLDFGVLPAVSSASGMFLTIFSSGTNTILYIID